MARYTGGWIKLYRKIEDDAVFDDVATLAVWTRLLLWASRKPGRKSLHGHVANLKRGQVLISADKLGRRLRLGRHKVGRKVIERALKELTNRAAITLERGSSGTIVTITNYDSYQIGKNERGNKVSGTGQPTGHERGSVGAASGHIMEKLQEEEKNLRPPGARAHARNDRSPAWRPADWEGAKRKGQLILEKVLAASEQQLSRDEFRDRVGVLAWAVLGHIGGAESFVRGYGAVLSRGQTFDPTSGAGREERSAAKRIADAKYRDLFGEVLMDPDFAPGEGADIPPPGDQDCDLPPWAGTFDGAMEELDG